MDNKNNINFKGWSCLNREKRAYSLGNSDIRRWYQRDIDQITHSTCFRKLQRKSQLLSEKDPRSRSRLIHTIEVSRIAMEISEKLGLSKELTEAICLAHDIGTSSYGYIGNDFLMEHAKQDFSHEMAGALMLLMISEKATDDEEYTNEIEALVEDANFSGKAEIKIPTFPNRLYVSRDIYRKKPGVKNPCVKYYTHHISPEIIDGVFNHGEVGVPNTLEGQVVRFADNIAYLSQDIEDLFTTDILEPRIYTKHASENTSLKLCKQSMSWRDIDSDEMPSLKDAFNENRGRRIAAFVSRFVAYNLKQLSSSKLKTRSSEILQKEIPILECDQGMQFVINYIWKFIERNYSHPLIQTSNAIQKKKMEQLWEIISNGRSGFPDKNPSYLKFMEKANSCSLFKKCGSEWKIAFFISHLSWFDVDLILDSYHERNNTFELDISY